MCRAISRIKGNEILKCIVNSGSDGHRVFVKLELHGTQGPGNGIFWWKTTIFAENRSGSKNVVTLNEN